MGFLSRRAGRRLKPTLQAEARATWATRPGVIGRRNRLPHIASYITPHITLHSASHLAPHFAHHICALGLSHGLQGMVECSGGVR
jgi:hypothetical protein